MVVNARPSSTTPVPTAAAALSPAPPTTSVSSLNPVSSAAALEMWPVTSQDSYTFASSDRSMFSMFSSFSDQQRFGTSSICIPDASLTSVAKSPVSI